MEDLIKIISITPKKICILVFCLASLANGLGQDDSNQIKEDFETWNQTSKSNQFQCCAYTAYGIDLDNSELFGIDAQTGEMTALFVLTDIFFYAGGTILNCYYYTIDRSSNQLYAIDISNGHMIEIANLNDCIKPTEDVQSLVFNSMNDLLYIVSTDCTNSTIYTLNLQNYACVELGTIEECVVSLMINSAGTAYAIGLLGDVLMNVNLSDASIFSEVDLNIDLNFAQDYSFSCIQNSSFIYGYAQLNNGGGTEYVSINPNTGNYTVIQSNISNQMSSFSCCSNSNSCLGDLDLTQTENAIDYNYEVNDVITSTSIIEANSTIIYDANQSIYLLNGFEVDIGSSFHALIDGCNN